MSTTSTHGQGTVRNPAADGRLKDNKSASQSPMAATADRRTASHGQGAVKNPATDGRIRDKR
jgi:hypothetical protein